MNTKPITIHQKSMILDYIGKAGLSTADEVWIALGKLDINSASYIIQAFGDRHIATALNHLRDLKVIQHSEVLSNIIRNS